MVGTHKTIFILRLLQNIILVYFHQLQIETCEEILCSDCFVYQLNDDFSSSIVLKITIAFCDCLSENDKKKLCQLHTNSILCNIIRTFLFMFESFVVCFLCALHMILFSVVQSTRSIVRRSERSESFELTKVLSSQ